MKAGVNMTYFSLSLLFEAFEAKTKIPPEFITLYFANPSLPLDRTVFFSLFLKFILLYMVVYDIIESWLTLKRQLIKKDEHMSIL